MSIRIMLLAASCLSGIFLPLGAQQPPALPVQKSEADSPEAKSNTLSILPCKYITSKNALKMLNDVLGPMKFTRIVADPSSNFLIVQGPDADLKKCKYLLERIDIPVGPPSEAELVNLQTEFLKNNKGLISSFAESLGVTFALNEEMGLMMLKGNKEQVKEIQQFTEDLKQVLKTKLETAIRPTSIAIRVIWLTNAQILPEMATENDTKLRQIIDRLAKQGIKNLAIGMQLISRCDPSPGTSGKCKVSGNVELSDCSQELFVESNFNQVQSSKVFNGRIEIRATRTPHAGVVSSSSVQVDVNAEAEKYYVLSSSPIGNHHSVFVVQLLDDF